MIAVGQLPRAVTGTDIEEEHLRVCTERGCSGPLISCKECDNDYPVWVVYDIQSRMLLVVCSRCQKPVIRVAVAMGSVQ